jgi:xanthine dehydrogenase molybdopterin binding subunit/xanthine dehydrogenase small subunit
MGGDRKSVSGQEPRVSVNGRSYPIADQPTERTLLDWLRSTGLTGSKQGCAEGDCGACTVAVVDRDANGHPCYRSINSCIALLPTMAGREVVTVEGLADGEHLHPAQEAMVRCMGSQCGYCTPGIVMSMFEACGRPETIENQAKIADQLAGNLCRCTGYRPIRDAAMACAGRGLGERFDRQLETADGRVAPVAWGNYFRPDSLAAFFAIRSEHPDAVLVCGATELGVEVNKRFRRLPKLISLEAISELMVCETSSDHWRIGAAVSLTRIEDAFGGEYEIMDEMLHGFASRQIRNRASLGGNLVTASPIGDSSPVLLALGASVELTSPSGTRCVALEEFFTGYRTTCLEPDEILTAILLPRAIHGTRRQARFFKVSKRREMDISIVSAAVVLDFDADGVIRFARVAYGGVAATPWLAAQAGEMLLGRSLTPELIESVAKALESGVQPLSDARGSAAYRTGLVSGLWRKFCSGDAGEAQDLPLGFVTGAAWPGDDDSRYRSHESAVGHVTGRAQYVDDQGVRRGMLTMWPVCSPHAAANIVSVDIDPALQLPGVVAVLTASDVPGKNNIGCSREDEELLASASVHFHGQVVAMVVGVSEEACRAGVAAVRVEYEPLPPILGIRAAIEAASFLTEPHRIIRGDATAAMECAGHRLSGEFEFGGQEHFYLETQAAWAEAGGDGDVFISSSTQHPSEIQIIVAKVLGLPRHRVVVEAPRMGGGFGGKETQGNGWAALAAIAALKTGKPVRIQLDRDLDMILNGKRHPFYARFEVGFDSDARLTAADISLYSDGGWALDLSMPIMDRAMFHLDNAYYIPAVRFTGQVLRTNTVSNTAFRGFGGPQGMLVIEEIIARIAAATGLPAEVVRERNLYHGTGETNTTHYGQDIGDNRIQTLWTDAMIRSEFHNRRAAINDWNATSPRIKRGLAVTPVKFGISFTYTPYNQAGALVLIYADGSVQVNHGGTEMGQGLNTKILGIAMRELGLSADRIRVMFTRTDKIPNTSATAASSGADLNGAAVRNACETLRERLRPVAAAALGAPDEAGFVLADGHAWFDHDAGRKMPFEQLCAIAYSARVQLSATGFYRTPEIHWDRMSGKGRPFYYFSCGVAVSEVEVDGWTGMHRVRRVDIIHDVGDSLNPGVDRGQIEGAFVQGMGWLTREELKWGPDGRLLTHSASTYQIPAFSDAPADFRISLMPHATQSGVVHGSKAVGEPPLMLAISVREALRDAVCAFGSNRAGDTLASPATCEAIWRAVQNQTAEAPACK